MKTPEQFLKFVYSKKFMKVLSDTIDRIVMEIVEDSPEEYGAEWDSNPYGVEDHLIGKSGERVIPDNIVNDSFLRTMAKLEVLKYVESGNFEIFGNQDLIEFIEIADYITLEWATNILLNRIK